MKKYYKKKKYTKKNTRNLRKAKHRNFTPIMKELEINTKRQTAMSNPIKMMRATYIT